MVSMADSTIRLRGRYMHFCQGGITSNYDIITTFSLITGVEVFWRADIYIERLGEY